MRLDKFLKVSRVIKRRQLAKKACDKGMVKVNGRVCKASFDVKEDDIIEIDTDTVYMKLKVLKVPDTNIKKSDANSTYMLLEKRRKVWE